MTDPVLHMRGLTVSYRAGRERRTVVEGFDLDISSGESHGLVGESGAGKSTIGYAITRFLPRGAELAAESVVVAGRDIRSLRPSELRRFRRDTLGFVYQEPGQSLNPTMTVGAQVSEVLRLRGSSRRDARRATEAAFERVALPSPRELARRYPHELSGGQQQRVVIAMALAARPRLLILDEPTTGLDSTVEAEIVELIERLQGELGFASLLISHNLPLVAAHCHRVSVLRDGRLVERGAARRLLTSPAQDYTRELIDALPSLDTPRQRPSGGAGPAVVALRGVGKQYGRHRALSGIDLEIGRGEVLGVVGESGSGKSTLGKAIAGLIDVEGSIRFADGGHRRTQLVFQNPDASLNPRRTVGQTLGRAIALLGGDSSPAELIARVGLPEDALRKLPRELSGGQKQRIAIARAFAGPVSLVVCDEPTSALDVSVQSKVIALLRELQEQTGVSLLFISHDLAVVRQVADRVAVLREGRLIDLAETESLFSGGGVPYTRALIAAARMLRTPPADADAGPHSAVA